MLEKKKASRKKKQSPHPFAQDATGFGMTGDLFAKLALVAAR